MRQIYANNFERLPLGRQGENLARRIIFDIQKWETLYGPGTAELIYQRPGDSTPYPIATIRDGSLVSWPLTSTDTAVAGSYGQCELRYYVGETLAKSKIWQTFVDKAMETPSSEAPPEPEQGWVDQILAVGVAAQEAAERAENAAIRQPYPNPETGTWWVWNPDTGAYQDSGQPTGGGGGEGNVSSQEVTVIKVLDREEYDALTEKSPTTLYLIRG